MERNKKAELGWVLFDWANSSYSLVISTAIFPIYFLDQTNDLIHFGSFSLSNASVYAYTVSLAYLCISFLSPVLSGIADYGGYRKTFMRVFTTLGSLACMSLFLFDGNDKTWLGISAFLVATASHAGSLVFYDSYLSQLVPVERRDQLSARGYAFGYIGSVILMCMNIAMIQKPDWFGLADGQIAARIAFFSVGLWWLGFSQFSFAWLPKDLMPEHHKIDLMRGVRELQKAWHHVREDSNTKKYLAAFFFYSAGVQTVIYLASAFAKEELKFDSGELILVILILQLVAIAGALGFAWLSKKTHNLSTMKIMIMIWALICLLAYFVESQIQFYVLAALVGLVLGGVQAISRSTYSKIIPKSHPDLACFYSFYNVIYYASIVFGTFMFGFINQYTGTMRGSVLALMVFFIAGWLIINRVSRQAVRQD
ncbi:MAG TPA: MFS transporter [Saprospiraceae bacterium]|nr:MFS transporter [Saprospiraceae bacterium]